MTPPCHGTLCALPGSYAGSRKASSIVSSAVGRADQSSVSSHPCCRIRLTTQSDNAVMSQFVAWPDSNNGTSVEKKAWLSLITVR